MLSGVCCDTQGSGRVEEPGQLRGVYGEHVADEIVANCGVEVAFTPKELRVANEPSERIGYVGQDSVTKSLTINGWLANRSKTTPVFETRTHKDGNKVTGNVEEGSEYGGKTGRKQHSGAEPERGTKAGGIKTRARKTKMQS